MLEAKAKELKSWVDLGAAVVGDKGETGDCLKSGWVLRWKKSADGTRSAKARVVVKGF